MGAKDAARPVKVEEVRASIGDTRLEPSHLSLSVSIRDGGVAATLREAIAHGP
jgi:hypothetical protein